MTWDKFISYAHNKCIENNNCKEIGKIRALANEYLWRDFLQKEVNKYSKNHIVIHNEDKNTLKKYQIDYNDSNLSGFDLILYNIITKKYKRLQVKYRNSDFHLETTRRNSKKNLEKNKTGHIAYSSNEFDYICGTMVKNNINNNLPSFNNNLVIIPVDLIMDPKNNKILKSSIKKCLWEYLLNKELKNQIIKNMISDNKDNYDNLIKNIKESIFLYEAPVKMLKQKCIDKKIDYKKKNKKELINILEVYNIIKKIIDQI